MVLNIFNNFDSLSSLLVLHFVFLNFDYLVLLIGQVGFVLKFHGFPLLYLEHTFTCLSGTDPETNQMGAKKNNNKY